MIPASQFLVSRAALARWLVGALAATGICWGEIGVLSAERVPEDRLEIELSFAGAVRKALPSVVSIYARRVVRERLGVFDSNPFFREFFGNIFPESTRRRMQNSLGSGILARPEGIVITADHVIRGAEEVRVVLADRREYSAAILLSDSVSDLAVLQLEDVQEDLPALEMRDADELEIGDFVLAIGNPLGVGQTVTSGIVSALARSNGEGTYFIQTDAAINVGNSGGALIDASGRLVGINTAILTRSGGSDGIGFAVPSNLAMRALDSARAGETEIPKPWAGINGQEVTQQIADAVGLSRPQGFLVNLVDYRSGFADAGIEAGDLLLTVDGHPVHTRMDVIYRMLVKGPGGDATVSYLREGREVKAEIPLVIPPLEPAPETLRFGRNSNVFTGAEVSNASPALAVELGVPSVGIQGVIVISAAGRAARWLRSGDLIRGVNGNRIRTVGDLTNAIRRTGRQLSVVIERDGRRLTAEFDG